MPGADHKERMNKMSKQERADLSPPPVQVGPLDNSNLYTRRHHEGGGKNSASVSDSKSGPKNVSSLTSDYEELDENGRFKIYSEPALEESDTSKRTLTQSDGPSCKSGVNSMSLSNMSCSRCGEGFEPHEKIVNSTGDLWHTQCFVCAQCFRPFPDGTFYEFEGRKYCEHDFHVLFAPCCGKCNSFVIGRVIKAMNANWHPQCFRCEHCDKELAELGFVRHGGMALCHECRAILKAAGSNKHTCYKCHGIIDEKPLRFRGEVYHPYHFNCTACGVELNSDAREVKSRPGYTANDMNELYCLRCHDKMGVPICGACRRPIEERVVTALGKHWHVEHFVCTKCEKPFLGHRHYEKKGLAYCETHYHQLFGNLCFVCNQVIAGDVFTAMNKAWCVHHFACSLCDQKMTHKTKFYELDLKPVCKKCYDKLPHELKRRLRKALEFAPKSPTGGGALSLTATTPP